ncbi:MAG: WGR domain-containing protein [Pararhodobacter sp.]|nr:WGR domain-containing protein [Pararhodobacter sp.]
MTFSTDFLFDEILLLRTEPEFKMRRFYAMSVQRDLFGGFRLVREWGRQGTRGREMATHYPERISAIDALVAMAARKRRRGYCDAGQG